MKDGRTYTMDARADAVEATRQRILDVARSLFLDEWYDDVTLNAIASGADVSHQTVLNHFGNKEGVFAAVAALLAAEVRDRRDPTTPGDTATAVAALLAQYEELGLANARAAYQEERVPTLKPLLDEARASHRQWIEHLFDHALPSSGAARRQKLAAFLAATEVTAWKSIRHDHGFSKRDTAAAITLLITALEAQP